MLHNIPKMQGNPLILIQSFLLNFNFQIFHILCTVCDDGLAMVELPQKSKSKLQSQYHCPILGTQIPTHTINKITDWCKVLRIREEKENHSVPLHPIGITCLMMEKFQHPSSNTGLNIHTSVQRTSE